MTTSHGIDDAVAVVQLHLEQVHPEMDRSRDTAAKAIKKM
jgi:hypothetical protein